MYNSLAFHAYNIELWIIVLTLWKLTLMWIVTKRQPIPVAAPAKAWVCGRWLAGTAGANPAVDIDVYLSWVLRVARLRSLRRADHSCRGVLRSVMCRIMIEEPRRGRSGPARAVEPREEKLKLNSCLTGNTLRLHNTDQSVSQHVVLRWRLPAFRCRAGSLAEERTASILWAMKLRSCSRRTLDQRAFKSLFSW